MLPPSSGPALTFPHHPLSSLSDHLPAIATPYTPFMDGTRLTSFLGLPSEILCQTVPLLSRHDLSICVRVCKAWQTSFMDSLWNKVELRDDSRHDIERPVFDRVKELYRAHFFLRDRNLCCEEAAATKSPSLRNLHRIRVINIQYTHFLNLFLDQDLLPLGAIPLEELIVDFEGIPVPSPWHEPYLSEPRDMNSIFQIFGRSTRLISFSFITAITSRRIGRAKGSQVSTEVDA